MEKSSWEINTLLIAVAVSALSFIAALFTGSLLPPLLLLALLAVTVIAFISFQYPWIFVYLIAIGSYLSSLVYFFEGFPLPITLFQLFLVFGIGVFLLHRIYFNAFELRFTGYELPVLCFLALIFLSLIYSPDRATGLFNAIRFIVLLIFAGFVLNSIYSIKLVGGLFIVLSVVGALLSVYSSVEIILNPEIAAQNLLGEGINIDRGSAGGIYNDPNRFAAILFLPIAFTFSVINSKAENKYKLLGLSVLFLLAGGLFSTFSRSGLISVGVIVLLIVALYRNWRGAFIAGTGLLIVILIIPELRNALWLNIERVLNLFSESSDDSSSIRVMLGIAGISMFFDSYLIGVGFSGFSEMFTNYYTVQESIGVYEPHNITYEILAELGVAGFLFYLFYIYVMLKTALKNLNNSKDELDKVISSTLIASFVAYLLFYQFYGGALLDSNLMLIHALIFVVHFQVSGQESNNR